MFLLFFESFEFSMLVRRIVETVAAVHNLINAEVQLLETNR